jgi:ABC-2 type transport system permease protein
MQDISAHAGTIYKPLATMLQDSAPVSMPYAAALSYTNGGDFTIKPLLTSKHKTSWNRVKPFNSDVMIAARVDSTAGPSSNVLFTAAGPKELGVIHFSPVDGDAMGPLVTAVSLTRKINNKEQRIIVAGDADFISNSEMGRFGTANFIFSTAIFSWLSASEFPIDGSRPPAKDKRINVTLKQAGVLRIVYVWIVPAILLVFGAILLIRRKRK